MKSTTPKPSDSEQIRQDARAADLIESYTKTGSKIYLLPNGERINLDQAILDLDYQTAPANFSVLVGKVRGTWGAPIKKTVPDGSKGTTATGRQRPRGARVYRSTR